MKEDFSFLYKVAQWNFSDITCGAEFEMIALDKEMSVPLNRTMMSVSEGFFMDADALPVGYGRNGKYYNTVGLINYVLWVHRAELKSSYHVEFEVPEAPSEDEVFMVIHILNLSGEKIGTIMPDGLSYMPEIVTSAGTVSDVKRWSTLIRSLIEFAVEKIDGRIADRQLPYVLGNYDIIDTIGDIPAKKNVYYKTLIEWFWYRGKEVAKKSEQGIKAMRYEVEPDLPCPVSLLQVKDCLGEQTLLNWWFAHNASTTSHHLHVSGGSLKETIDMFMGLMRYEGKVRYECGTAYFEQLGKWYMRHIAFWSLIALRYRMSKKSKTYLEKQWITDMHDALPDELESELEKQHLLIPDLRVTAPLSNGWDPEGSLACKIYKTVQDSCEKKTWWMIAEQKVLELIAQKFFARPEDFIEAYTLGKDTVDQSVLRSHSDIVLKAPGEPEPGQFILTVEMRWQDYPPLTDFSREETREAYVIQNNLYLLQRSTQLFTDTLQKFYQI